MDFSLLKYSHINMEDWDQSLRYKENGSINSISQKREDSQAEWLLYYARIQVRSHFLLAKRKIESEC